MTSVIKDRDKFYPQLFLEEVLYNEQTQHKVYKRGIQQDRGIGACQMMRGKK